MIYRNLKILLMFLMMLALPVHSWAVDTDGDGVSDALDLDNDNDGIPDLTECATKDITIEKTIMGYGRDLMECTYHSCVAKSIDGFVAYGQEVSATNTNSLSPIAISPANGYNYTGDILRVTMGGNYMADQLFILSTDGLYVQQDEGNVVHANMTSSASLQSIPMPTGVNPLDVKVIKAGYKGLLILTNNGVVWGAGADGYYGDGTVAADINWHKVDLPKKIAFVKTAEKTRFAQAEDGTLYTWGQITYKGDGSAVSVNATPVEVTTPLPSGVAIVQIGLSGHAYFVLGDNRKLYSMGENSTGVYTVPICQDHLSQHSYFLTYDTISND